MSLGTRQSAGETFGCIWKCQQTNAEITNEIWEIPGFELILIGRTAGVIWDSPDVHKKSISLNGEYDAWIIGHYWFWIILATIFFNTVLIASLHYGTNEIGKLLKHKRRYTETKTRLNSQMISIKHGVNVIHNFSHLIRANESRNTWFINDAKKLEALLVCAEYSYVASGWNWVPMSFGSSWDIRQRCNEMLASCESKLGFERQYDIFRWKRGSATRDKRSARWEVLGCRSAEWNRRAPNWCCSAPIGIEQHPN